MTTINVILYDTNATLPNNTYKVIQNNLFSLKEHILDHILRWFFLYKNFVRNLVFKLQEKIFKVSWVVYRKRVRAALMVRCGCFTHGAHIDQMHLTYVKTRFFFFPLLLSFPFIALSLSFTYFKYINFIKL